MTGINDDFGDPGDRFVRQWESWIWKTARDICWPNHMDKIDDVRQEGRIALWHGHTEPHALRNAERRMRSFAFGRRPQTGHTRGAGGEGMDVQQVVVLDAPVNEGVTVMDLLAAVDLLGEIEIAYHHGEIMQAINSLPDEHREYLYRRFWEGWNDSEIARSMGVSTSGMHNRWVRTIRPALIERLQHLAAA